MGIRLFCDHCGNTVSTIGKFRFGPKYRPDDDDEDDDFRKRRRPRVSKPLAVEIIEIDLCNRCAPIWMERVKKFTGSSDPGENKNDN